MKHTLTDLKSPKNHIQQSSRETSTNRSNKGPKICQNTYFMDRKKLKEQEDEAPEIPDTAQQSASEQFFKQLNQQAKQLEIKFQNENVMQANINGYIPVNQILQHEQKQLQQPQQTMQKQGIPTPNFISPKTDQNLSYRENNHQYNQYKYPPQQQNIHQQQQQQQQKSCNFNESIQAILDEEPMQKPLLFKTSRGTTPVNNINAAQEPILEQTNENSTQNNEQNYTYRKRSLSPHNNGQQQQISQQVSSTTVQSSSERSNYQQQNTHIQAFQNENDPEKLKITEIILEDGNISKRQRLKPQEFKQQFIKQRNSNSITRTNQPNINVIENIQNTLNSINHDKNNQQKIGQKQKHETLTIQDLQDMRAENKKSLLSMSPSKSQEFQQFDMQQQNYQQQHSQQQQLQNNTIKSIDFSQKPVSLERDYNTTTQYISRNPSYNNTYQTISNNQSKQQPLYTYNSLQTQNHLNSNQKSSDIGYSDHKNNPYQQYQSVSPQAKQPCYTEPDNDPQNTQTETYKPYNQYISTQVSYQNNQPRLYTEPANTTYNIEPYIIKSTGTEQQFQNLDTETDKNDSQLIQQSSIKKYSAPSSSNDLQQQQIYQEQQQQQYNGKGEQPQQDLMKQYQNNQIQQQMLLKQEFLKEKHEFELRKQEQELAYKQKQLQLEQEFKQKQLELEYQYQQKQQLHQEQQQYYEIEINSNQKNNQNSNQKASSSKQKQYLDSFSDNLSQSQNCEKSSHKKRNHHSNNISYNIQSTNNNSQQGNFSQMVFNSQQQQQQQQQQQLDQQQNNIHIQNGYQQNVSQSIRQSTDQAIEEQSNSEIPTQQSGLFKQHLISMSNLNVGNSQDIPENTNQQQSNQQQQIEEQTFRQRSQNYYYQEDSPNDQDIEELKDEYNAQNFDENQRQFSTTLNSQQQQLQFTQQQSDELSSLQCQSTIQQPQQLSNPDFKNLIIASPSGQTIIQNLMNNTNFASNAFQKSLEKRYQQQCQDQNINISQISQQQQLQQLQQQQQIQQQQLQQQYDSVNSQASNQIQNGMKKNNSSHNLQKCLPQKNQRVNRSLTKLNVQDQLAQMHNKQEQQRQLMMNKLLSNRSNSNRSSQQPYSGKMSFGSHLQQQLQQDQQQQYQEQNQQQQLLINQNINQKVPQVSKQNQVRNNSLQKNRQKSLGKLQSNNEKKPRSITQLSQQSQTSKHSNNSTVNLSKILNSFNSQSTRNLNHLPSVPQKFQKKVQKLEKQNLIQNQKIYSQMVKARNQQNLKKRENSNYQNVEFQQIENQLQQEKENQQILNNIQQQYNTEPCEPCEGYEVGGDMMQQERLETEIKRLEGEEQDLLRKLQSSYAKGFQNQKSILFSQ